MGRAEVETLEQFASCWEGLEDPRQGNARLHDLHELLVIALCCVLCGGHGAVDMALFAAAKEPFLRSILQLANGLPSHDTFSRLFRNLDPEQFRASFQRFMSEFAVQCTGVVAIDGKVVRRSFDRASSKSALHMVSAWGSEHRLVLAQIATDAKSNEITAVPKLLRMLTLKGTIVTTDALNCQRAIAAQIVEQEGDYALALKANQESLYDDVVLLLNDPQASQSTMLPVVEADHGRIETRRGSRTSGFARSNLGGRSLGRADSNIRSFLRPCEGCRWRLGSAPRHLRQRKSACSVGNWRCQPSAGNAHRARVHL